MSESQCNAQKIASCSQQFLRVYSLLIQTASLRGLITYGQLANGAGLPQSGSNMGRVIGQHLGSVVEAELACGRPMLSAVAVSVTNHRPSEGFYLLAEKYGLIKVGLSSEEQIAFWRSELVKAYDVWRM
jgi:alkylated DNA nucleotide flippase Atl1